MKRDKYIKIKEFNKFEWITASFMALFSIIGLYMSISFSVKVSQGYTLFGDSNNPNSTTMEVEGPTSADIRVLVLYWVLTALLLVLLVYYLFFRKKKDEKVEQKDIVDGKVVIIEKEKENEDK